MGIEIERKFLVTGQAWKIGTPTLFIQGYLNHDKNRTVRIRIAGDEAMITVKGLTVGMRRAEYEYLIPVTDAKDMLELCEGPLIEKKRWLVSAGNLTWEVDEFMGDNQGLVVAEIELEDESQSFEMPVWVGKEVTDDARYYNSSLSVMPFKRWG
ncbi:MAG: CYTH domain-containing protein [Hellea sp.]